MAEAHHRPAAGATATAAAAAVIEIIRRLQTVGYCLDLDTSGDDQISPLFHRLLSLFLSEIAHAGDIRPPPHTPFSDAPVDLFLLFCSVRERGGYVAVTAEKAWPMVAEGVGFDPSAASATKLLYSKHLLSIERWIGVVLSRKSHKEAETPREMTNKVLWTPTKAKQPLREVEEEGQKKMSVEDVKEMVGWVRRVARRPGHTTGKEVNRFEEALLARELVFESCSSSTNGGSLSQKRPRVHPSVYDDTIGVDREGDRKLRCSQRILGKSSNGKLEVDHIDNFLRSCTSKGFWNGYQEYQMFDPYPETRARVPPWTGKKVLSDLDSTRWLGTQIWPPNEEGKPHFERNSKSKRSEDSCLCEVSKGREDSCLCEQSKGRQDSCLCEHKGSIECVRFHIAEKRLQLKREINSAFHCWKFNNMGEEVALSWKEEEEYKFKSIVRQSRLSPDKRFWEQLFLEFPYKSRQNLVSYYFNVFLLRRRGYQNRVTPANIDSDDEEPEFGFLSQRLGENTVKIPNPKPILCAQNEQCFELEDFTNI